MAASLSGMTLPSWASHLRHRLAPPPLLLVQAFVNTRDLDLHTDVLAHADEARAWLADAGLRDPGQPDFAAVLPLARAVRESLRAMIGRNTGGPAQEPQPARPPRPGRPARRREAGGTRCPGHRHARWPPCLIPPPTADPPTHCGGPDPGRDTPRRYLRRSWPGLIAP